MKKLQLTVLLLLLIVLAACSSSQSSETNQNSNPEEAEQENAEASFEEVTEEEAYDIIKDTIGSMYFEMNDYFRDLGINLTTVVEENPIELAEGLNEIIAKRADAVARKNIFAEQLRLIEENPMDYETMFDLSIFDVALPIEIVEQDESNLVVSYYSYGQYYRAQHDRDEEDLTKKITVQFTKLDNAEGVPWKLTDYQIEGVDELEFDLTHELIEESELLNEYLTGYEADLVLQENATINGRDVFNIMIYGHHEMLVDVKTGIFISERALDMENITIEEIIAMLKEEHRQYAEHQALLERETVDIDGDVEINYTITENSEVKMEPQISRIFLKPNQKVILDANFEGEAYDRVLVNGVIMDFSDETTIEAINPGYGKINIIPYSYEWDNAKDIDVIVME